MPFDVEKIKRDSKHNYEKSWLDTKNLLRLEGHIYDLKQTGKSHIINDFIFDARKKMISLGFEEIILPMFVDENEVYRQYGPEAALILDRLFYLAGLPRPDIGISNEKIEEIQVIIPNFERDEILKTIFRDYKKGKIEADDLIEEFVDKLQIREEQATEIIDKIFPEFKQLKPIPSKSTLRSHTTALWFIIIGELIKKKNLPLQYFSIGPKFRREQKIDATHLYCSNTLSMIIVTDDISLEDCQRIASNLCEQLDFKESKFVIKKATSKYYAPQTEFEIYIKHPKTKQWIEIGDGGFYSPVSLAQYNISVPVFNIGFGVERICMIKSEIEDIRKLVYPYFYEDISFSDKEISKSIHYKHIPLTEEGINIKNAIIEKALQHKNDESPVEIEVWEGIVKGKNINVKIWERDEGVKLLGPAALNKVWVKDGSVFGVSSDEQLEGGIECGLTYLEGIASEMAYNIEVMLDQSKDYFEHRVKMCYRASEVNIELDDVVLEFIHSKQKKIDIRGPVFTGLSYNIV